MRLNSTLALTLILLSSMLGAGFVSSMWGFTLGHEALKAVTQPDSRPNKKLPRNKLKTPGKEGLAILREEDILIRVKAQIDGQGKDLKSEKEPDDSKKSNQLTSVPKPSSEPSPEAKEASLPIKFPIKSQDRGVTLEVISANQQGNSLLLNVSLKNKGDGAVRFLYSFLNVTDEQGRALSAITDGLPGELPPNGKEFYGTVSIPTALLSNSQKLSLALTDYPDQKLQLKMAGIPVVR